MSPILRSLDLFSGVGGITKALEGIARPVAYCEIDENCQMILKARMSEGGLPQAPIISDVKKVTRKMLLKGVDMIVGGWPCQDISVMGKRKGLVQGKRSSLIFEVIRLVDELQPKMLFLENVPAILKNGIDVIIHEFVKKRGYHMRWGIVPASAVGALHVRKRWFCLLVRPGFVWHWEGLTYKPYRWSTKDLQRKSTPRGRVPLMVVPRNADERRDLIHRARILGNSVVPDAVRAAFITLASGFVETPSASMLSRLRSFALQDPPQERVTPRPKGTRSLYKSWGMAVVKDHEVRLFKARKPQFQQSVGLNLVVSSDFFPNAPEPIGKVSRKIITRPVHLNSFNTPRHESHACNALTERTIMDLPTMLRFERETPDAVRGGVIDPRFVEWLMGYKNGWTMFNVSKMV